VEKEEIRAEKDVEGDMVDLDAAATVVNPLLPTRYCLDAQLIHSVWWPIKSEPLMGRTLLLKLV
jgi:hypothetical protein